MTEPNVLSTRHEALADRALAGEALAAADLLDVLRTPDAEVPLLVAAAYRLRHRHFGRTVQLHMLVNAKSGLCPEDCGYCSQSKVSSADIPKYNWMDRDELLAGAERAHSLGVRTYCIVASGRGPSARDIDHVTDAVQAIKAQYPLKVCCCLGLLTSEQAHRLKAAGVDRVNHNLNTSEQHHDDVVSTHSFGDRVATLRAAHEAGLSLCSGGIAGMGEDDADLVDMALALRDLDVASVPMNFLHPVDGTPMAGRWELQPLRCLKVLCMARFAMPAVELRVAGGRELHLRSLQSMGLLVANSIFLGDYLTTAGQQIRDDLRMVEDLGFALVRGDGQPTTATEVLEAAGLESQVAAAAEGA